jgi:sugar lactone lactonase YvrE
MDGATTVDATFSQPIISTVAGNGTAGYNGDNISAINAELNSPGGVAVDTAGNIYIVDSNNDRIRKVTVSTGIITTVAGNGTFGYNGDNIPATEAELYAPYGVAVDSAGNIYIADFFNCRIRKVTFSTGLISTVAGNGTCAYSGNNVLATSAELYHPNRVALDAAGNIYLSDAGDYRVRKVTVSTGMISNVAGNGTYGFSGDNGLATSAELYFPDGLAVDSAGNIYIADYWNDRIRVVNTGTTARTIATVVIQPGDIATVAGNGYNSPNSGGFAGDNGPATSAELYFPTGVALDSAGNIYISDSHNGRIREVVASTGIITTVAGGGTGCTGETDSLGDGCAATSAEIPEPWGVAVDSTGIYVADVNDNRIRAVVP